VLQRTGNTVTGVMVSGTFISGDTVVIAAGAWSVNFAEHSKEGQARFW